MTRAVIGDSRCSPFSPSSSWWLSPDRIRRRDSRRTLPRASRCARSLASATQPFPQIVAVRGPVRLQMPITQSQSTAIGYHSASDGALTLAPLGRQGNEGVVQRVFHAVFGGAGGHPTWYRLDGGALSALDVGAAPGTDVYSPVDGTVVGISPYVVAGHRFGVADRHPAAERAVARRRPHAAPARRGAAGRQRRRQRQDEGRSRRRPVPGRAAGARALHERRGRPRLDRSASFRSTGPELRILFLADVFGTPGRLAVEQRLPGLRDELDVDVCIVNGENVADGAGITGKLADKLLASGADAITLGNHAFRRDGIGPYLDASDRVIRPANAGSKLPGRGLTVVEARNGVAGRGDQPPRRAVRRRARSRRGRWWTSSSTRRARRRRWSSSTSTPRRRARRSRSRAGSTDA